MVPLSKGGRMAEKEETITVAVRLPASQVIQLREILRTNDERNMSELLRGIVTDWLASDA